jgi:microcompartment protein CcmK/EutM
VEQACQGPAQVGWPRKSNACRRPFVATDASAQASSGNLVTWEAAREAARLHDPWFIPVDHAVVGIVDQHHLEPGEQR